MSQADIDRASWICGIPSPCAGWNRAPNNRDQIGRQMLALTTYLGHAKVESTYWYLESTPELMVDLARRCEAFVYGGTV